MKIYNKSYLEDIYPDGITISDTPYNQNYHYSSFKDRLKRHEYVKLLSGIKKPCVLIHYPEETINILPEIFGVCEQVVSWVYNSNTGKQHRLISWWGCKPDFRLIRQPYKNPNDRRIKERIANGHTGAKLYDWWNVNQVKNISKEKTAHPCQIPEEIIRRIIVTTVKKGQTIIDPFLGSGTTGKVAIDLGHEFIGYEIDIDYYNIAINRLKNIPH